jgi:hypothetical protein
MDGSRFTSQTFFSRQITTATTLNNNFFGTWASPLADNQTNQVEIGYDANGLGSNTSVLGNTSTVF